MMQALSHESGNNWRNCHFNGMGFDIGTSWDHDIPEQGHFEGEYITEPDCSDLRVRCPLARRLLFGPGVGRWRSCLPPSNVMPDSLEALQEVDGVHPSPPELKDPAPGDISPLAEEEEVWEVADDGRLVQYRQSWAGQRQPLNRAEAVAKLAEEVERELRGPGPGPEPEPEPEVELE